MGRPISHPSTESVDLLTSIPHLPLSEEQISTTKPSDQHEMDLIPRQKSAVPTDSDCGSVVAAVGTCRITTNRSPMGNASFRNGRLPSNLAKDIRIGIGGVGDYLLTNEFIRWGESGDQPPSLSCSFGGIPVMGGLARYVCIGYRLRLPPESVGEAKY